MGNVQPIAYSMIHEYLLGRYPTVKEYNDRLVAQKIGYLSQVYGIYIGDIKFFWNKRGPYSRSLTPILYSIERNRESIIESCTKYAIVPEMKKRLDIIKNIVNSKPSSLPEYLWLEICASIKFISKELNTSNLESIKEVLFNRKPFMKDYIDEIETANKVIM